jgi:predicted dehydrogenase
MTQTTGGTVRIGLIGAGAVVRGFHLPALRANPRVRVVVIADPAPASRDLAAGIGADHASDPQAVFARADVDAVVIATPPHLTAPLTIQAVRAGKPSLSEKPLGKDVAEGRAAARASAETGRLVQLGFILRHGSAIRTARRWVDAGRIGTPVGFRYCVYNEPWLAGDPDHKARLCGILAHSTAITTGGSHGVDLMSWFLPSPAVTVTALAAKTRPEYPGPNHWTALFQTAAGGWGEILVSWLHPMNAASAVPPYPAPRKPEIEIYGSEGCIFYDWQGGVLRLESHAAAECVTGFPPLELDFPAQLACFLDSLDAGRPLGPSAADGYRAVVLTESAEQAWRERRVVEVPGLE